MGDAKIGLEVKWERWEGFGGGVKCLGGGFGLWGRGLGDGGRGLEVKVEWGVVVGLRGWRFGDWGNGVGVALGSCWQHRDDLSSPRELLLPLPPPSAFFYLQVFSIKLPPSLSTFLSFPPLPAPQHFL